MATQKGLGKGLGALFGDINEQTETPAEGAVSLPLQKIEPNPLQPRKTFDPDELASLAESIRMHGIIQPLTVRKLPSGFYQIIAGERRWRAARLAGLSDVPVVIIEADDKKAMELALIENLQRADLNPIEEALGYQELMGTYEMTQEQAAARVGKSRPAVANALRLLSLSPAVLELVKDGTHMFNFPGLHLTETVDESKALNEDHTPKVIISASGMCDAGRIRHHLKYNLWRADSAVVFVGFQSPGTLGRTLLDGTPSVKLFGEDVAVRAKVVNFQGLSSHADHDHLLDWIGHFKEPKPQHVFVVHGDREVAPVFAQTVSQLGFTAHAPQYTEEYDLLTCTQLAAGYLPQRKTRTFEGAPRVTAAYQKLVQLGDSLVGLIRRSKGRDNKTLASFAEALRKVMEKFEI